MVHPENNCTGSTGKIDLSAAYSQITLFVFCTDILVILDAPVTGSVSAGENPGEGVFTRSLFNNYFPWHS
jgi:hypothetical protein